MPSSTTTEVVCVDFVSDLFFIPDFLQTPAVFHIQVVSIVLLKYFTVVVDVDEAWGSLLNVFPFC